MPTLSNFISPLLLAVSASTCSTAGADSARPAAPREILVTATDFAFRAADSVPAGLTRVRLRNDGPALHHLQLVRLEAGHTVAELLERLAAHDIALPWLTFVGGPETPPPGEERAVTIDLSAGQYAMICFVASSDHVPHVAKGMIRALTVTPSADGSVATVADPQADIRMELSDYAFAITPEIAPGRHTVRVENAAAQPHHVDIMRLAPGKTRADAESWAKTHQGPPPFDFVGGTTALTRGHVAFFTADFTASDYLLICFVPDAKDGKSHASHGMVRELRVS